ncbi:helix-turn-helix domain-containing protein [Streptomyces sp. NPDC055103]
MRRGHDWTTVIDLIERVVGEEDLLASSVASVRATVPEIAQLTSADIAGHTRALLVAATRALEARRGPTPAEMSFVEELAVARARQGVPVEAVLRAIHVAERAIWSRAREVAAADGVPAELLLDARELFGDWAESVRARLIAAHRTARAEQTPRESERATVLLRRLLAGGSAAVLAAAEAGLPVTRGLWVLVSRPAEAALGLQRSLSDHPPVLSAVHDGLLTAILAQSPAALPFPTGTTAGVAGPADPEGLAAAQRLAVAALTAAQSGGRTGVIHIADVATLAAVADRADLAAVLLARHRSAWSELGPGAAPVAEAVSAWLEANREAAPAAQRLFVHPNTVRNRLQRFADVTGIDPHTTFGAVDAWWLCRAWLAQA